MAVARTGPSDARVPCPLCGGLIHPIAGKCKHCKADLTVHQAARPAASTPLPALHRAPTNGHNGHAGPVPAAHAPVAAVEPPVLPPRPTARNGTAVAAAAERAPSSWRSWPVLVIVLAMIAIVAAAVLMVWPTTRDRAGAKSSLRPPPAPEHMPTDPTIRAPHTRPQRAPQPAPADPQPQPQTLPAPQGSLAPDDQVDDDQDLDALANPYTNPHGRPSARGRMPGMLMAVMLSHVCKKLTDCHVIDATTAHLCDQIAGLPTVPPANCPAARRCLDHIDAMSCGNQPSSFGQLGAFMNQFRDCADAASC